MICQAMDYNRLCSNEGIRTVRGNKMLCIEHIDSFFKGNQIKWAPKRLLSWEIERRARLAVERRALNHLNDEEYHVRDIR